MPHCVKLLANVKKKSNEQPEETEITQENKLL